MRKLEAIIRKIENKCFEKKLEKDNFYEDIIIENECISKEVKKIIARWMYNLQYSKRIRIKKFKDLFKELDEIVFPINIDWGAGIYSIKIIFQDKCGENYYMHADNIYGWNEMNCYSIGRRNGLIEPFIDREFCFQINKDSVIELEKSHALHMKSDGKNDNILVDFCYNKEKDVTEATLQVKESAREIKIIYPVINEYIDSKILKHFINSEKNWYYYNVLPIVNWLKETIDIKDKLSFSIIAKIGEQIFSEIEVVDNIVQKYTMTEVMKEDELNIITKIFAQDLKEFLQE